MLRNQCLWETLPSPLKQGHFWPVLLWPTIIFDIFFLRIYCDTFYFLFLQPIP